jgi:hypothetical protein
MASGYCPLSIMTKSGSAKPGLLVDLSNDNVRANLLPGSRGWREVFQVKLLSVLGKRSLKARSSISPWSGIFHNKMITEEVNPTPQ